MIVFETEPEGGESFPVTEFGEETFLQLCGGVVPPPLLVKVGVVHLDLTFHNVDPLSGHDLKVW